MIYRYSIYFNLYKEQLYKNCSDFRRFSHCQEHYLFQFDSTLHQCHSYYHENCSYYYYYFTIDLNETYTNVTVTFTLSPDRMNRLSLHFQRWKGPMSVAIQLDEEELPKVAKYLSKMTRSNVRFTLYVVRNIGKMIKHCSFITMNGSSVFYDRCFVINELRNLAIETIQTTHFMLIDGDSIISSISCDMLFDCRNHSE